MKILKLLLSFWILLISQPLQAQEFSTTAKLRVVVYGNEMLSSSYISREYSFSQQLQQKLKISGFDAVVEEMCDPNMTTVDAIKNIDVLIGKAPDLVILQLGEADINRKYQARAIYDNFKMLIKQLKKQNIYVVLVGNKIPETYGTEYIKAMDKYYGLLKKNTTFYPYVLENIEGNHNLTLGDNVHPNSRGVDYLVNAIYPFIDTGLRWRIKFINDMRTK